MAVRANISALEWRVRREERKTRQDMTGTTMALKRSRVSEWLLWFTLLTLQGGEGCNGFSY